MNNKFYITSKDGHCNFATNWANNLRDEFLQQYSKYNDRQQCNYIKRVRYFANQLIEHGNKDSSLSVAVARVDDINRWMKTRNVIVSSKFYNL